MYVRVHELFVRPPPPPFQLIFSVLKLSVLNLIKHEGYGNAYFSSKKCLHLKWQGNPLS